MDPQHRRYVEICDDLVAQDPDVVPPTHAARWPGLAAQASSTQAYSGVGAVTDDGVRAHGGDEILIHAPQCGFVGYRRGRDRGEEPNPEDYDIRDVED